MQEMITRGEELAKLFESCMNQKGYLICVALLKENGELDIKYIKRDFFNVDILGTIYEFKKLAYNDSEGLEDEVSKK